MERSAPLTSNLKTSDLLGQDHTLILFLIVVFTTIYLLICPMKYYLLVVIIYNCQLSLNITVVNISGCPVRCYRYSYRYISARIGHTRNQKTPLFVDRVSLYSLLKDRGRCSERTSHMTRPEREFVDHDGISLTRQQRRCSRAGAWYRVQPDYERVISPTAKIPDSSREWLRISVCPELV